MKKILIIFGVLFGFLIVGAITATALFFGDNVSINTSRIEINGNVDLSIGYLKGNHEVDVIEVTEEGSISIPYEATVQEGQLTLLVKHSGKVVWEKVISPADKGNIEFSGAKGTYYIQISTEEAKNIDMEISF